jgi:hypothetical protein
MQNVFLSAQNTVAARQARRLGRVYDIDSPDLLILLAAAGPSIAMRIRAAFRTGGFR